MIRVLRPTESEKLDGYRQVINVTTLGKSVFRRLSSVLLRSGYARGKLDVSSYENAVRQREPVLLNNLVTRARQCDELIIQDFDAYDHHGEGMTLDDVLNNPDRKMGHGFVLAMMIEEEIRNG